MEQRQHVSPQSDNTQTVDLGGLDQEILLYHALYFSEAGSVRASQ